LGLLLLLLSLQTAILLAVFGSAGLPGHDLLVQLPARVVHHSSLHSLGTIFRGRTGDGKRSHMSVRSFHVSSGETRHFSGRGWENRQQLIYC